MCSSDLSVPVPPALAATPSVVPKPQPSHAMTPETGEMEEDGADAEAPSVPAPVMSAIGSRTDAAPMAPETTGVPAAAVADRRFADEVTLEVIQRAWPRILKAIEKTSPAARNFLEKAQVRALDGKSVTLAFHETFARDRIQAKAKDLVEKKLNEGLKTDGYKILCVMDGQGGGGGTGVPPNGPTPASADGGAVTTLLDTPATPAGVGVSRIMDFQMPAAPSPSTDAVREAPPAPGRYGASHAAASEPSISNGLLAETLNIFGGEVVKSEPIVPG